ncbi:secretory carrier-associated membrane protein 1-like [Ornithodoros turicata]|uniref:secretory carrier-associated membrane protein 1-like n=1 Tax=Ornithodoros turicata TaxID=34597 RepID=UPI00313A1807
MSGFDSNPFADPHAVSPFADPAVTQVTSQTQQAQSGLGLEDYNPFADQPQRPRPVTQVRGTGNPPKVEVPSQPAMMQPVSEPPPAYSPNRGVVPTQTQSSTSISTAELQKRQEELERKAAELQAREEALRNSNYNVRANNWPPLPDKCCVAPCFYQDIGVDIPLEFQKIVRTMYYLWMFYVVVLLLNFLGAVALLVKDGEATLFGFSVLYLVLFAPLSFLCWFRPLYKAFRSDSSFNFMVFFFVFFVQLIVAVILAVGVGAAGACGFVVAIKQFSVSVPMGIFLTIVSAAHAVNAAAAGIMLLRVHRLYRGTGASFAKAQQEFTSGVLRNEHVQGAAQNVAANAARATVNQTLNNRY